MARLRTGMAILMGLTWLIACGASREDDSTKARFMALNFWQSSARGMARIYFDNDRLMYKRKAVVAIEGDAAADYRAEIDEVLTLVRQNFDLEVVYGSVKQADVKMLLYYGENSRNATRIKKENWANQRIFERIGAMQYYDAGNKSFRITQQYRPYGASDSLSLNAFFGPICETRHVYDDANLQAQTFWSREVSIGQLASGRMTKVPRTPDFSVVLGFMGVPDAKVAGAASAEWAQKNRSSYLKPLAFPCIYEELVHALTFWRDLPDSSGRVAFTGQYQGSPSRHATAYRRDLPELQEMMSYYRIQGMSPDLNEGQTRAVLGMER